MSTATAPEFVEGDIVKCQAWNRLDGKYYGDVWKGQIFSVAVFHKYCEVEGEYLLEKSFLVFKPGYGYFLLCAKEILDRAS